MLKRKTYSCGVEATLALIAGKWKPLIIWNLKKETMRFGALKRAIPGISEKMLIQELKQFQLDGIVRRKDFREVPPRVEYSLSAFGLDLAETLEPLCDWGAKHLNRISKLPSQNSD